MSSPPSYAQISHDETLDVDVKDISTSEKKELLDTESTISTLYDGSDVKFTPTKTLHINARGIRLIRFPIPSSELEIPIYNDEDGAVEYTSTREKMCSGNAILSAPGRGNLVSSNYRFGPGRNPTLKVLNAAEDQGEVKVSGRWTSRSQDFSVANGTSFEWTYKREPTLMTGAKDGDKQKVKKATFLVLEAQGVRLAQLVRTEETRTLGTSPSTAGNGGALMIDEKAIAALKPEISEELVVATCIMMLKKEIDRRRAIQIMMFS
jgi:hypothetical protein